MASNDYRPLLVHGSGWGLRRLGVYFRRQFLHEFKLIMMRSTLILLRRASSPGVRFSDVELCYFKTLQDRHIEKAAEYYWCGHVDEFKKFADNSIQCSFSSLGKAIFVDTCESWEGFLLLRCRFACYF